MNEFDRTNTGGLWNNKNRTSDKAPFLKGDINVDGVEYWLSAWYMQDQSNNRPVMQLRVQRKDETPSQPADPNAVLAGLNEAPTTTPPSEPGKAPDFDDDIPF